MQLVDDLVGLADIACCLDVEIDQRQLLGIVEERVVEAPKEQKCFVRRRTGEEIISVEIPCTN